jgi:hypothetical protein
MSQRSEKLLRVIADKLHKMAEEGHFCKLAGTFPVQFTGDLVGDILQWRRGTVEAEKQRNKGAANDTGN